MLDIDLAKAKELVQLAIGERGEDYVYPYSTCINVVHEGQTLNIRNTGKSVTIDKDQPGCIVGLAMFKAGLTLDQIDLDGGMYTMVPVFREADLARFTVAARAFLGRVQENQDDGMSWGKAYDEALGREWSSYDSYDGF